MAVNFDVDKNEFLEPFHLMTPYVHLMTPYGHLMNFYGLYFHFMDFFR